MTTNNNSLVCFNNCSGHGECHDGICICEVEFTGKSCDNLNLNYYIVFSSIFFILCFISFIQLVLCINSEFYREKPRSFIKALRVTTQKGLYFFICIATAIRGFYFQSSFNESLKWASDLKSAYYPLLLSGSSLLVCFWAEAFHLNDFSTERPGFLSKSFCGFILFNVITYSLFFLELILIKYVESNSFEKDLFLSIFNGIYAALLLFVIVFFLIYGIEVFIKVRGAFIKDEFLVSDTSQLHQSRLGFISQAIFFSFTVLFILLDVLGSFWKTKVPVVSRNTYQITFQVVEIAVALWFPCCLWNCLKPETLWILNPRKLLKNKNLISNTQPTTSGTNNNINKNLNEKTNNSKLDCWICYDNEKPDILIQPCKCKGDVSVVHHNCLKLWLMESNLSTKNIRCKVCKEFYQLSKRKIYLFDGFELNHYLKSLTIFFIMGVTVISVYFLIQIYDFGFIRTVSVGAATLIEYVCLKILGVNLLSAYHKAKFAAIIIKGKILDENNQPTNVFKTPVLNDRFSKLNYSTDEKNKCEESTIFFEDNFENNSKELLNKNSINFDEKILS